MSVPLSINFDVFSDAARLAEELRQEQEHSMHNERLRKGLEQQLKEMQVRLDEVILSFNQSCTV